MLQVFTGSELGQLTFVAGNDDAFDTLQSAVTFTARAGRVYAIQVDGFCRDAGSFVLNLGAAYNYETSEDTKK